MLQDQEMEEMIWRTDEESVELSEPKLRYDSYYTAMAWYLWHRGRMEYPTYRQQSMIEREGRDHQYWQWQRFGC